MSAQKWNSIFCFKVMHFGVLVERAQRNKSFFFSFALTSCWMLEGKKKNWNRDLFRNFEPNDMNLQWSIFSPFFQIKYAILLDEYYWKMLCIFLASIWALINLFYEKKLKLKLSMSSLTNNCERIVVPHQFCSTKSTSVCCRTTSICVCVCLYAAVYDAPLPLFIRSSAHINTNAFIYTSAAAILWTLTTYIYVQHNCSIPIP